MGHLGAKRTLTSITERFMWPGVSGDVYKFVSCVFLKINPTMLL